jgi:hypothetical protein
MLSRGLIEKCVKRYVLINKDFHYILKLKSLQIKTEIIILSFKEKSLNPLLIVEQSSLYCLKVIFELHKDREVFPYFISIVK